MNHKKNENVDELAGKIAELAIELKNELKTFTSGRSTRLYVVSSNIP